MMILIGQFDSPFVRRVAIALGLYGMAYEHRPWSVFADAEKLRAVNPLLRVPTLVTEAGLALTDSHMILDYLDHLVPSDAALFPQTEPDRHQALRLAALAGGMADKAVSLFYEARMHQNPPVAWVHRLQGQILGPLQLLEQELAARPGPFFGPRPGHADILLACAVQFISEAHPGLIEPAPVPHVRALCRQLEAMPIFQATLTPFAAPA